MEHSPSSEPMRRGPNGVRIARILHAMSDRFTGDPRPAMSNHYKQPVPGTIGSVEATPRVLNSELEIDYLAGYAEIADSLRE